MIAENINILLADDENTECHMFKELLEELTVTDTFTIVHNGVELNE